MTRCEVSRRYICGVYSFHLFHRSIYSPQSKFECGAGKQLQRKAMIMNPFHTALEKINMHVAIRCSAPCKMHAVGLVHRY